MALGDLVQMLEGLPGSMGDVPYSTESAELPWLACGQTGWNPATNSCNPLTPVKSGTDWTPYVLGGAALLAVWALFFREGGGLSGSGAARPPWDPDYDEAARIFGPGHSPSPYDINATDAMLDPAVRLPPYTGPRFGPPTRGEPLPPARRMRGSFQPKLGPDWEKRAKKMQRDRNRW